MGASEYGGVAALPVWVNYMRQELRGEPIRWVSNEDRSKATKETQKVVNLTD